MLHGPKRTQKRARQLRRQLSLPEVLLWVELRKRPAGLKFRKQHPAGRYVLYFFCAEHRLAIEVDGEAHSRAGAPEHDTDRDAWLRVQGVRVLRIPAAAVLGDLEAVVRQIVYSIRGDYPLPPSAFPSPSGGGLLTFTPTRTGTR
jgi:very-short-patch-repair endonuclease